MMLTQPVIHHRHFYYLSFLWITPYPPPVQIIIRGIGIPHGAVLFLHRIRSGFPYLGPKRTLIINGLLSFEPPCLVHNS